MNEERRNVIKLLTAATVAGSGIAKTSRANATHPKKDHTTLQWGMVIDLRLCIGCQACSVACNMENQVPLGYFRTLVSNYEITSHNRPRRYTLPRLCNHCDKPACVTACPTMATTKRPDGTVVVDNSVCIGCGYCVQACPYDARFINEETHTADKCTFCLHRLQAGLLPACVETCVTGARVFGDLNDPESSVAKLIASQPVQVLKKSAGTVPQVYYIGLDAHFNGRIHGEQVMTPAGTGAKEEEV